MWVSFLGLRGTTDYHAITVNFMYQKHHEQQSLNGTHDYPLDDHFGTQKTLELIFRQCYWQLLKDDGRRRIHNRKEMMCLGAKSCWKACVSPKLEGLFFVRLERGRFLNKPAQPAWDWNFSVDLPRSWDFWNGTFVKPLRAYDNKNTATRIQQEEYNKKNTTRRIRQEKTTKQTQQDEHDKTNKTKWTRQEKDGLTQRRLKEFWS